MLMPVLPQIAVDAASHSIPLLGLAVCYRVCGKLPAMMEQARLWDAMRRRENRLAKLSGLTSIRK